MNQPPDLESFLGGFLAEAEEHLRSANAQIVSLDEQVRQGAPSPRQVRELFRSMHTIKGLAGMVGVEPIVDLTHALETTLRAADHAGGRLDAPALDLVHRAIRAVEERVQALEARQPVAPAPRELIAALEELDLDAASIAASEERPLLLEPALQARLSPAEREELLSGATGARRAVRLDFVPSQERAAAGVNITSVRAALGELGDIVKVFPLSRQAPEGGSGGIQFAMLVVTDASDDALLEAAATDRVQTILAPQTTAPPQPLLPEPDEPQVRRGRYVRVDVERLDVALDMLAALVVTRHRLERAVADLSQRGVDVRELGLVVAENARQLRDARSAIMRARLVPVAELLERVPLIVRGLARSTGKQVRLALETGRAELDKAVGDRLFPAIVHLVRNAVDHGIEPPEARRTAGKPEEGRLTIRAWERGNNQLEIEVEDDGAGIDAAEVARRAGIPAPEGDTALLDALARPGLSTTEQTTTTSGRGMGVDIIRRVVVGELGGDLSLENRPGGGATFQLRVPLSITILDAFSFVCGGQTYVVPVTGVEELVDLEGALLVDPPGGGAVRLLERRGQAIPLIDLARTLGLDGGGAGRKAIVAQRGGETLAFAVDRMLGQQEIVVRPLADPLVRQPGIAGTTDLGDGRPSLVLDLLSLPFERTEAVH